MSANIFRKPEEWEIQRAADELFRQRMEDLMGEALNEADELKKRRIVMAVESHDPLEVGQLVMDVLEAYCKPDDEAAYLRAVEVIEFGDGE